MFKLMLGCYACIFILLISLNPSASANGDDGLWFCKGNINFGHCSQGWVFCFPKYLSRNALGKFMSTYRDTINFRDRWSDFAVFPEEIMKEYINDSVGDTVLFISSIGRFRTVVIELGYYSSEEGEGLRCRLELIDTVFSIPNHHFLALKGDLLDYSGPFTSYDEFIVEDSSFQIFRDSIYSVMTETYIERSDSIFQENVIRLNEEQKKSELEWRESLIARGHYPFYEICTTVSGKSGDLMPDTLFMFNRAVVSGESRWVANYLLIKFQDGWRPAVISEPGNRGISGKIICTFDLNDDGELEYLIDAGSFIGVYIFNEGEFTDMVTSDYWGD